MEPTIQKVNEQLEKLKYLEGTKEKNLQILNNRIKEINEEKRKREQDFQSGNSSNNR